MPTDLPTDLPANPTTIIRNGTVVLADRIAPAHDVAIANGRITAVEPTHCTPSRYSPETRIIDASGCYVAPGFIDIHSDYIEGVASPRPSVVMDLRAALYEADRSLVAHGVTTMFHSLSIYKLLVFDHKPIRRFDNVSRLIECINRMRGSEGLGHLIRHRLHVRVELDAVDHFHDVEEMLLAGKVDLISFMDHTPGQGQYRDLEVFAKTIKSYKGEISDAAVQELVDKQQAAAKLSFDEIAHLAGVARQRGVSIASHDDSSADELRLMQGLGASISEFPISMDVAHQARGLGMHTIAGAPNVLLGYSHSGNLSAREAVCAKATDILCSDYYPAALLRAVFELHHSCGLDLAAAFALVTVNPARAVGIDDELGEIAPGKRADILLIREMGSADSIGGGAGVGDVEGVRCAGGAEGAGAGGGGGAKGAPPVNELPIPIVEEVLVEGHSVFSTRYPAVA